MVYLTLASDLKLHASSEVEMGGSSGKSSDHTDDYICLTVVFLYLKFTRRQRLNYAYADMQSEHNIEGLNILQLAAFGMYLERELTSDIDGKAKDTIPAILIEHPLRKHLFGDLSELQIHYYCSQLDQTFERQEYCAQCESWSYFDEEEGAAEFALGNAAWLMDMVQHVPINSPSDGEQGHIQLPTRPAHYDNWALPKLIETVIRQRFESLQRFLP